VIDNLPALWRLSKERAHVGLPIGIKNKNDTDYYIYNHLTFRVEVYHSPDSKGRRIVGFSAVPKRYIFGFPFVNFSPKV